MHFAAAVAADPSNAPALNNLGVTLERKGNKDEARVQYEKALNINPEFEPARNNLQRLNMVPAVGG